MIKKIKNYLTKLVISALFLTPVAVPAVAVAQADIQGSLCEGADLRFDLSGGQCDTVDASNQVNDIITLVINVFSVIVGVVAVIMIIYGGFKYITSGGAGENVSAAKNTILYAIVGLVVVALAQIIVRFVLSKTVS